MYTIKLGRQEKAQKLEDVEFKDFFKSEDKAEAAEWAKMLTLAKQSSRHEGFPFMDMDAMEFFDIIKNSQTFAVTGTEYGEDVPEGERFGVRMRVEKE